MHVHACLLALRTGKPVKMSYNREESFFGHVHRHPASAALRVRRDPRRRPGLRPGRGSTSTAARTPRARAAVVGNAGLMGVGPVRRAERARRLLRRLHEQPAVRCDARLRLGAGRVRLRGADGQAGRRRSAWTRSSSGAATRCGGIGRTDRPGDRQRRAGRRAAAAAAGDADARAAARWRHDADLRRCPAASPTPPTARASGAVSATPWPTRTSGSREGFDDYSTARVRLEMIGGEPVATVHTAAAEVGQGLVTVEQQICRTELGVERVVVAPADTAVGTGGSTSASRQTYVTGGAVQAACRRRAGRRSWRAAAGRRRTGRT